MDSADSTCDNSEAHTSQETLDSEIVVQTPSMSEDKESAEYELEEKVCLNINPELNLHTMSSHVDSDSNEEIQMVHVSPKIERSANLSLPKTTLLGKLKAKQRLNAFLALRSNATCTSIQKKFKDCDESGIKVENKTSPVKKVNKKFPDDIAKAVIEEIEMMKKVEIAMIESIEQDIYEKSQRRSRSRSKSWSKERSNRYKEPSYRRYKSHSRSSDRRSRYLEKESYPKNWTEMKIKHLKLEDVKEIKLHMSRHQKKYNGCHDFRKQALFLKPSLPLKPLVIKSVTGMEKTVPVEHIRYTHSNPSISYSVNFIKVKNVHISEKEVYDIAPKLHKETLEKLRDPSIPSKCFESPKKSPRKWYLKTPLTNVDVTECELLEPSLGLSILQNYTDEEDDEKGDHEGHSIIDNSELNCSTIQSNAETDKVIQEDTKTKIIKDENINFDLNIVKHKNSWSEKEVSDSEQESKICNTESLQKEKSLSPVDNLSITKEESKKRKRDSKKTDSKKISKKNKTDRKKKEKKKKKEKNKDSLKEKKLRKTEKNTTFESKSEKSENKKLTMEKSSKRKQMKLKYKDQEQTFNDLNIEVHIGDAKQEIENKKYHHDESIGSKVRDRDKMIVKIFESKKDEKQIKGETKKYEGIRYYAKEEKYRKEEKKKSENTDTIKTEDKKRNERVLKVKQVESFESDDSFKIDNTSKVEYSLKVDGNIKIKSDMKTINSLKPDTIIDTKKENRNIKTDELMTSKNKPEPELRTPDTEEYHSHWESDEDVSNAISYSPLSMNKPNQIANTSWESDDEMIKTVPLHKQKSRGRYVEVSPQRSSDRRTRKFLDAPEVERSLEMPLNIKHLSRRRNDNRDTLGVGTRLLYSEDSWERGEYLKLCNDIETEKLKQERESLSEERRLLEKEKRKLAEKLEQVTSNLVYKTYDISCVQEVVESNDNDIKSIQKKREELLGRSHKEKNEKKEKKMKSCDKNAKRHLKSGNTEEKLPVKLIEKNDVKNKTKNEKRKHFSLKEIKDDKIKETTENNLQLSEFNFVEATIGSDEAKTEVVKRKRKKNRWESVDVDCESKLNIDDVLVEENISIFDEHESKLNIDEVLVGNFRSKLVEHKQLSLDIDGVDNLVENKTDLIDKQTNMEHVHSNNKKGLEKITCLNDKTVLNKTSVEIIPETVVANSVASVNKVVILESEYEEFMKAVTSENYTDEKLVINHEDNKVKLQPVVTTEAESDDKYRSEKKKRKRSTSSSSSSSSSSYSSDTDSTSSSYSSSTTSSSSTDDGEKHKKKGKKKSKINRNTFSKVKQLDLEIDDFKPFPISKDADPVKDNKTINKIKEEDAADILIVPKGLEKEENEVGKTVVNFCVPLPVPSPAVVPPPLISHVKVTPVTDENSISSSHIDSTTSPIKRPTLIPAKFLTSVARKQQFDTPETKVSTLITNSVQTSQSMNNSNSETSTKFVDSFQAVEYPILEKKCHSAFSLHSKYSVSNVCLNENSGSQDFTDLFKKTESDVSETKHETQARNDVDENELKKEVLRNDSKLEGVVDADKRERSLSPFVKKSPLPEKCEIRDLSPKSLSPKRLRNLSPKQNRNTSPRRSRNISPKWSPLRSSPKRSRITSPRSTRNRDLSIRSISPKRNRRSSDRRRSPRRYLSERELSPRKRSFSPGRKDTFDYSYSPRRRDLSPLIKRSLSPKRSISPRYRDLSPRRNYSPRRNISPPRRVLSPRNKNLSPRHRSISPRYRDISPEHRCYSPRGRDISPRRRNYSPRREKRRRSSSPRNRRYRFSRSPSTDRSKKEPIQLTLQRLAGLDNYTSATIKSPINSPLDGFKRSLADSTISDDQLLQQNLKEFSESPRNPSLYFENKSIDLPCSPKRIPLDERINFVLGVDKEAPKHINTTYSSHYAYSQYGVQYDHFTSYENQIIQKPHYVISGSNCREDKSSSTKVVQIGNVLEVVPTENVQSIPSPSREYIPQQKILQVGNMLQIVPAPKIMTTVEPLKPHCVMTNSQVAPSITAVSVTQCITPTPIETPAISPSLFMEKMSPETLMKQKISEHKAQRQLRHEEREKKRREKEKRRKEKEKQRQIRIKQKTDNMIKQAILLETEALALGEDTENQENVSGCTTSDYWPSVPTIVSNPSIKPAGKGILISHKISKQNVDDEGNFEPRKSVKFADGVIPGEGTSPSGGEELTSPPPMKIPLPKEKRYTKSIKIKKQKKIKVPKKKKIKVKIIRKALESQDDSEDDNLPPPSPPPGSPPPHIFPPRIKPHTINNIHPTFVSGIQSFPVSTLHQFRPSIPVNMSLPPHGPPHGLPVLGPSHSLPPQGPPHSSAHLLSLPHESQFQHSGLPHPPPPGLHH